LNNTKNFSIGEIVSLVSDDFIPYVGATKNANLGAFSITSSSFIVGGGLASQFLKANGTLDSTVYVPASRTLTINGTTYDLSANRTWNLSTLDSLTTIGTGGAATYISNVLNIPIYQPQGNYITQLSGEATAAGPGNATVTLSNLAVISKILTGLNITGGTVTDTDSILTAFGKVQNQINGLTGGVTYQGTWNAATNTPTLTSSVGTKGYYYVVNVAGSTNLNGITDWKLGDWAIFNGSTWEKVDNTDAVVSVNGYTGAVVLTFSDVGAPPATRTLTINGTEFDLTANRSWTVGDVRTDQTYSNPSWITSLGWNKITSTPTTLAGYGITDGASNTTTLTINGVTFDISANRTWNVGTVTSVGTSGPLTGGTITGSGTIGITQSGASSDGYLSSTDWNTFNNKQGPLVNPVTGTGTIFTIPMWSGATSLVDSPLSYGPDAFNFQYNSATGGTVNFTNIGLTSYTYAIQMNNFGSPRSTVHSYTDGIVVNSIGGTQVSRMFANGNFVLGTGFVDNGYKLEIGGNLYINTIANATTDTDRFIVSDGGVIKYRTGAELLSDIGAQGALTLTTTGSSGPATLISNVLNIPQYTDQFVGTVTSVGLSMPPAFTVSNSPITSAGTLTVVGAGTAAQYVRGDGALATLPTSGGGGGASVSYYLNGSVNQGTIGGVTYYEMNKTPIIGAGADFTRNTNGYIASFLTDANDPSLLEIPAGNWNFETYFQASSGGGSPTFYIELYKYDGTTFTLIASNSGTPKLINDGTSIEAYFSALAVPQTTLAITDRLAVRIYVNTSGRTITLHTENGHLCQVITTFTTGLTALNGLTAQVQYLAIGTSGTDFNILSTVATHTFNLPTASAINRGALSSSDWSIFNGKQNAITLTTTGTSGAATLVGATLNIPQYQSVLTNPITGTGTINYLAKFTGASAIGDSLLFDSGVGLGLGTASINASALFQMDSTTKGFLPPRMTAAQRGAISAPAQGLIVYQTDGVIGLYIYSNSVWRSLTMV
jgi:predicted heme/steroid binding protein